MIAFGVDVWNVEIEDMTLGLKVTYSLPAFAPTPLFEVFETSLWIAGSLIVLTDSPSVVLRRRDFLSCLSRDDQGLYSLLLVAHLPEPIIPNPRFLYDGIRMHFHDSACFHANIPMLANSLCLDGMEGPLRTSSVPERQQDGIHGSIVQYRARRDHIDLTSPAIVQSEHVVAIQVRHHDHVQPRYFHHHHVMYPAALPHCICTFCQPNVGLC